MRSTHDSPTILTAHLGHNLAASKAVIAVLPDGLAPGECQLLGPGRIPRLLTAGPVMTVPGWRQGPFTRVPLPDDLSPGTYAVRVVDGSGRESVSEPFEIAADRIQRQTMSDVLAYFRAMRSSGEIDRKDRHARLWGDESGREVDARGGWLDASGDPSKFLSHLTYTRTMSPQQIPLCAWAMAVARDAIADRHPDLVRSLGTRLRDEALWGADFLMRFRAAEGYFYTGIFDALTKRLDERFVTAPLAECVRTDRYQAAYRQGGGLAIAALARASTFDDHGDFTGPQYLEAALSAFTHLEAHNLEYLDDGTESVIDDYAALLAACELVGTGAQLGGAVGEAARLRARALCARYVRPADGGPGWFRADMEGRPFFHAVEAGLPVLALLRFAAVLPDAPEAAPAREVALEAMLDTLARTSAVPNPFGYPRQRVRPAGGSDRDAFFFPHANETGYWWQGENATIASLAAAAAFCADADGVSTADRQRLLDFADDQLAWITGRNPFQVCMLQGRGRGNVDYESDFPNLPGGIVNGITSGWTDEDDIAFLPADAPDGESWRWAEQWIPHTGWFLLAVAAAR
ncbi:glycoside hydrolase family 9 protein [Streptomyces sp. NPDC092369]|uniref:glycoside hydrolase family 9 protein n=1 Tax=Streptomyces sp. NPDC092369 TaxID=3366015 RepID=UPI0038207CE3